MKEKYIKLLLLVTLILGGLLVSVYAMLYTGVLRFNYPSTKTYPVRGIDVSHHQGKINWKRVAKEHIQFVYIKATEGATFQDPRCKYNWAQARKHGIIAGAYHFFNFCTSPVKQATNFIRMVPNKKNSLPPVIDIEFIGYCKVKPSKLVYEKSVRKFISLLEKHYKKRPVIYTTYESYNGYLDTLFSNHSLWIRDMFFSPTLKGSRQWHIWQYSNRGHVQGIKGFVDLNVFKGTRKEFRQFIGRGWY